MKKRLPGCIWACLALLSYYPALAAGLLCEGSVPSNISFSYNTTCRNDTVRFNILSPQTYDSVYWNFGDPASGTFDTSTAARPYHVYKTAQSYPVQLIVFNGGLADTTTEDITIVNKILYDLGPDTTLCEGGAITLNAPFVPNAVYRWQDSSANQGFTVTEEGTYKVAVNGCEIPDSVNVFFTRTPSLELGADLTLCTNESIRLDATNQNATYQWYRDGASVAATANLVIGSTGLYKVVEDIKGCGIYKDSVDIRFTGPAVPFTLGADTMLCPGESLLLNPVERNPEWAQQFFNPMGYRWSNGATAPSVTISDDGDYSVFVNMNNTCEVLDTIRVSYNRLRDIDLGNDTAICKNEVLVLNADYGTGDYRWQDGSKQAVFFVTEPGQYYVTVKIGRCTASDSIQVVYEDSLHVDLGPDTTLCMGQQLVLSPAGAGLRFKWQDSSNISSFAVSQAGIYSITAVNACGTVTDSVKVDFEDCNCRFFVPNSFTPNGDGRNDVFHTRYRCNVQQYELHIFDRLGRAVYTTTDPLIGWNGYEHGREAPMGTYVWYIRYTDGDTGRSSVKSGSVLLLR